MPVFCSFSEDFTYWFIQRVGKTALISNNECGFVVSSLPHQGSANEFGLQQALHIVSCF